MPGRACSKINFQSFVKTVFFKNFCKLLFVAHFICEHVTHIDSNFYDASFCVARISPWLLMVFDDGPVAKEVKNVGIIVDNSLVHVLR